VNPLAQRVAALIEAQGPLSVAQFMTMALHDPQYGYYATRDPLGAKGDFTTAPEISQMFGELLGLWMAQCWHDQSKPSPARLVELGPGRGTLMRDAAHAARLMPGFVEAIEISLVESNPVLQATQQEVLADCGAPIRWFGGFDDSFADRPLLLVANEFFDALPIRQFVRTGRGWCERMVTLDPEGALEFALAPDPTPLSISGRGAAELGAVYEASPAATALIAEIAQIISRKGGAALILDYGYGADSGFGETLQAVGGHAFKSLLDDPGNADLSAHVDFGQIAQTARENGASTHGPVNQGDFLDALGLRERARRLATTNPDFAGEIFAAVERLIDPVEMGVLFKVLAVVPGSATKPAGF
jgi:SAM-dependent MidA family methyltransferase